MSEKTNTGTRNYGYDAIYQLTNATYERNQSFSWHYDDAGNRTFSRDSAPVLSESTYVPNSLNQYSSVNSVSYSYDSDGNLLSDGVRTFTWDAKNRLSSVTNAGKTITYTYDHNDLRVSKTVDGVTTRYFYDGSLLLAEKVGSQITKIYINDGQGIVGMVRPIYDGSNNLTHYQRLYYLFDSLGSVSAVTGEHGLPLQNYSYSPYGTCLNVTGDPINNLQFVGRYGGYLDSDTGLTYFWHRWYDSKDGRFISKDPLYQRGILSGRIGNIINSSSNCSKTKN
ncbi:MAG TPA: RHS repeat-associated core domain-containing protein, partial [Candidatus Goldiibacteriota bacterium]|nr:RHS repeat-associated core domain-containing protein [Candidatus Goldiibacteriota bacterium]